MTNQGAIGGSIAQAYFGVPDDLKEKGIGYLDDTLQEYFFEYADQLTE